MKEKFPLLIHRIQSTFIDMLLIILLMFTFASILDKFENPADWIRVALFFGIWIVYEPLCTSLGFTLGNYIKGIRVRKASDATKKNKYFSFANPLYIQMLTWMDIVLNDQHKS